LASTNRPSPAKEVEVAFQWNIVLTTRASIVRETHSRLYEGGIARRGIRQSASANVVNRYARKRNLLRKRTRTWPAEDIARASRRSVFRSPGRAAVRGVRRRASSATSPFRSLVERATNEIRSPTGSREESKRADRSSPSRCKRPRAGQAARHARGSQRRRARSTAPDSRAAS